MKKIKVFSVFILGLTLLIISHSKKPLKANDINWDEGYILKVDTYIIFENYQLKDFGMFNLKELSRLHSFFTGIITNSFVQTNGDEYYDLDWNIHSNGGSATFNNGLDGFEWDDSNNIDASIGDFLLFIEYEALIPSYLAHPIYNDGTQEGFNFGYDEGYSFGYNLGYNNGILKGENKGFIDGYQEGLIRGNQQGINEGYQDGLADGLADGFDNGEIAGRNFYGKFYNGQWISAEDYANIRVQQTINEIGNIEDNKVGLIGFIPSILGSIGAFFFTLGSFEVMGISLLEVIALFAALSVIILIIKLIKGGD